MSPDPPLTLQQRTVDNIAIQNQPFGVFMSELRLSPWHAPTLAERQVLQQQWEAVPDITHDFRDTFWAAPDFPPVEMMHMSPDDVPPQAQSWGKLYLPLARITAAVVNAAIQKEPLLKDVYHQVLRVLVHSDVGVSFKGFPGLNSGFLHVGGVVCGSGC